MDILLKNGEIYLPESIGRKDILIKNGCIVKIDNDIKSRAKIIDCTGKNICPLFVDGHTHLSLTGIYNHKKLLSAGIGSVVGLMSMTATSKDVKKLIKICKRLKNKGLDAYCLTGAFRYFGNITEDIINNENVIGCKTALNSKTKIREESPNYEELLKISQETYNAGKLSNKKVQVHIHLESTKASSLEDLQQKMSDKEVGNLYWIDDISKNGLPYSLFKLTHSQKYLDKLLEYANKGCYVDYTAMQNGYDVRFDSLINSLLNNDVNLSQISISSDMGAFGNKKNQYLSLLNTLKIFVVEKRLPLDLVLPFFTSNPGSLLHKNCGKIMENTPCKLMVLNKNLDIEFVANNNKIYRIMK